jgi:hypothetical protein
MIDNKQKQSDIEIEIDGEELTEEQLLEIQGGLGGGPNVDIVQFAAAYGEPRSAM